MTCPNCGKEADFREESGNFTETHGLDCGPYETWTESWLVCSECKAETNDKELREAQPPEVNQDIPLTRQAIIQLANIMGSGASEGYALACSDIALIVERNVIRFPDAR